MATGFSRSVEGRQEMIYDYCCTTSACQNLNAEALFYCKDCRKLLCEECNKYHAMLFKGHRVLGREEVAEWGDVKLGTSSFMCDKHTGKELEMYCEDHDAVCCHTCIGDNHRGCKEVKLVSEVSKGIQKKTEFKSLLSEAANTQSRLTAVYDKLDNNIESLQKKRGEITESFKHMRKKFSQIIDMLEENSISELDRYLMMLKVHVSSDQFECSNFIRKIQKFLGDIQTLGKQCDDLAFQGYKKCSEHMASADMLLSSLQNVDFQLKFIPDSKIDQYLSSLKKFGSFHVMPADNSDSFKYRDLDPLPVPPDHVISVEEAQTYTVKTSGDKYECYVTGICQFPDRQTVITDWNNRGVTSNLPVPPHQFYSVEKKQTYNVKTSGDKYKCFITGICQLPDGQTAVVDGNNRKVKLLSALTYCVLDALVLPPEPQDICHTTGIELVVTVCQTKVTSIQFINAVNGKLSQTITVSLDDICYGVAYHNDQLYVISDIALYMYTLSGIRMKKIILERKELANRDRLCLSEDSSKIFVTHLGNNLLLILDSSGKKLSTFRDSDLVWPTGVCVADNFSVFVSGWHSNTILQVDLEGKRKMTTLATKDDGVYRPLSLCYHTKTNTLLVGQTDRDDLLALQLKLTVNFS